MTMWGCFINLYLSPECSKIVTYHFSRSLGFFSFYMLHQRNWDKFEDSYRTLQFSSGDKCWNGPDRSLKAGFPTSFVCVLSAVLLCCPITSIIAFSYKYSCSSFFRTGQIKMWPEKWVDWCRWAQPLRVSTVLFRPVYVFCVLSVSLLLCISIWLSLLWQIYGIFVYPSSLYRRKAEGSLLNPVLATLVFHPYPSISNLFLTFLTEKLSFPSYGLESLYLYFL